MGIIYRSTLQCFLKDYKRIMVFKGHPSIHNYYRFQFWWLQKTAFGVLEDLLWDVGCALDAGKLGEQGVVLSSIPHRKGGPLRCCYLLGKLRGWCVCSNLRWRLDHRVGLLVPKLVNLLARACVLISFYLPSTPAWQTKLQVGPGVCRMRQNPEKPYCLATGGKENCLKVWDLQQPQEPVFKAKNVSDLYSNSLGSLFPGFCPWVQDLCFCTSFPMEGSSPGICVTSCSSVTGAE